MKKLAEHLDACQEQMLELIEKDSQELEDQIDYWDLVKRENLLLFAAKEAGLSRLGYEPVPPTKVSEGKAKNAIMMSISLQSLQSSEFGRDPWTLPQTSLEVFMANPSNCFKKNGEHVEVLFDGDKNKAVIFVKWGEVYVQDLLGAWHKCPSHVVYEGIYYNHPDYGRTFYLRFEEEAAKYGAHKPWQVMTTNGTLLHSPSESSNSADGSEESAAPSPGPSNEAPQRLSFWGSPAGGPERGRRRRSETPRKRSFGDRRPRPQTPLGGLRRKRVRRGRGGGLGVKELAEKAGGRLAGTPGQTAEGGGHTSTAPGHYPVLIGKGRPNCLKCWRNRFGVSHKGLFLDCSSTFSWTQTGGGRGVDGVILIVFETDQQLQTFVDTVHRPTSISLRRGGTVLRAGCF